MRKQGRPPIHLAGHRYGKLVVKEWDTHRRDGVKYCWICICDCGNQVSIRGAHLLSGHAKTCGCSHIGNPNLVHPRKPIQIAGPQYLFKKYISSCAKRRKLEWKLTFEEFQSLISKPCCYCGQPRWNSYRPYPSSPSFPYMGIDRKNNEIGYVVENCVSCCIVCNAAKSAMNEREFVEWVTQVYTNLGLGAGAHCDNAVA